MSLPLSQLRGAEASAAHRLGKPGGRPLAWRFVLRRMLPLTLLSAFAFFLIFPPSSAPFNTISSFKDNVSNKDFWSAQASRGGLAGLLAPSAHAPSDLAPPSNRTAKPRAGFVALVRDRNLDGLLSAMRDMQWAFNDDPANGYDYYFLSEAPFSDFFKTSINRFLQESVSRPQAHFGLVEADDWRIPDHIDIGRAAAKWQEMGAKKNVPYGGSKTYRQMCRYYSSPIFHHPILSDLDYMWRIEPDTKHLCRYKSQWQQKDGQLTWLERDPFRYMKANNKKYAWIITLLEYTSTVRSLMVSVHKFLAKYPNYIAADNLFKFICDDGLHYSKCHFWTNYEIIDLSFVRSQPYKSFFDALDNDGGFFYERWGDAPVRSIAASILLSKDEIWHVDFAGYHHPPYTTCPRKPDPGSQCACDPQMSIGFDAAHVSCTAKWLEANGQNSTAIIAGINAENGVPNEWGKNEQPYASLPERIQQALDRERRSG